MAVGDTLNVDTTKNTARRCDLWRFCLLTFPIVRLKMSKSIRISSRDHHYDHEKCKEGVLFVTANSDIPLIFCPKINWKGSEKKICTQFVRTLKLLTMSVCVHMYIYINPEWGNFKVHRAVILYDLQTHLHLSVLLLYIFFFCKSFNFFQAAPFAIAAIFVSFPHIFLSFNFGIGTFSAENEPSIWDFEHSVDLAKGIAVLASKWLILHSMEWVFFGKIVLWL